MRGRVTQISRLCIQSGGSYFVRRIRWRVRDHGKILSRKLARHLRKDRAHQIRHFVHLDTAIQDQSELIFSVQHGAIDCPILRISVADSIEKIRLTLLQLVSFDPRLGGSLLVLRNWRSRNWNIASRENRERANLPYKRTETRMHSLYSCIAS